MNNNGAKIIGSLEDLVTSLVLVPIGTSLEEAEIENVSADEVLSAEVVRQLDKIEVEGVSRASVDHSKRYASKFQEFLLSKGLEDRIESCSEAELNGYLRYFYSELRGANGRYLSPSTLGCIRAGISRYLTSSPVNRSVDVIHGIAFAQANRMLRAMGTMFLRNGGRTSRYSAIEDGDMAKLRAHFDRSGPAQLQDEIIFSILYFFGNRGRETLRQLTRYSFEFGRDSYSREYVAISSVITSKNVRVDARVSRSMYEDNKQARAYAIPSNTGVCPVAAFKFYLSKLPTDHAFPDCLFPAPLRKAANAWYSNKQVRGKNTLGDAMKRLSEELQLSKRYTNHCVRVTVVSTLADHGVDTTAIQTVTGHKNCESVNRYKRLPTDKTLVETSGVLAKRLNVGANSTSGEQGPDVLHARSFQLELDLEDNRSSAITVMNSQVVQVTDGASKHNVEATAQSRQSTPNDVMTAIFRGCSVTIQSLNINYNCN